MKSGHRGLLVPLLLLVAAIGACAYSVIAMMSLDALWFLGGTAVPDPEQIVLRVDGEETVWRAGAPEYDRVLEATRTSLGSFKSLAPLSGGLSQDTREEYKRNGTLLELYFDQPVDFHLPFNDGRPTSLLIPIRGRLSGKGYVFMGRNGDWWSGQMVMEDSQPIMDALTALGYLEP